MRCLLGTIVAFSFVASATGAAAPNIVVIFADDLGYGDLGCYGAKNIATPHLDQLAREGIRFTDFYVAQPVCSASRAGLLTGCYPNRIGIHGALNSTARHGINATEITLGELVKQKNYATGIVGKWHLGHHPQFLPTRHGFDEYFGLPYSNDMWPHRTDLKPGTHRPLPLFDNETIVNADVTATDLAKLTTQYTERAVSFIAKHKDRPFLLYVAHTMPHVPLFVSDKFKGQSKQGLYGDVVQEIDWSVGRITAALDEHGLRENTLVFFTSDNGPWLSYGHHGGSAGPLREGKGTTFEGGVRVPAIARWPGKIPAGAVGRVPLMTIDLFPTIARLIDAELPKHKIDGRDVWPLFEKPSDARSPHEAYFFYYGTGELQAVRAGNWKLMLPHKSRSMVGQEPGKDGLPGKYKIIDVGMELYDLANDLGETTNVADQHPEILKRLMEFVESARNDLGDSLTKRIGTGVRKPGQIPPTR